MNVLTPNTFTSFYYPLTKIKLSLINTNAFLGDYDTRTSLHTEIKDIAAKSIRVYSASGFTFHESPLFPAFPHLYQCMDGKCRLLHRSDDKYVHHTEFTNSNRHPFSTLPVVSWSLGGFECGKSFSNGLCEGSMVNFL